MGRKKIYLLKVKLRNDCTLFSSIRALDLSFSSLLLIFKLTIVLRPVRYVGRSIFKQCHHHRCSNVAVVSYCRSSSMLSKTNGEIPSNDDDDLLLHLGP